MASTHRLSLFVFGCAASLAATMLPALSSADADYYELCHKRDWLCGKEDGLIKDVDEARAEIDSLSRKLKEQYCKLDKAYADLKQVRWDIHDVEQELVEEKARNLSFR